MIKIFHTADLHLDSPFSSLTPTKSEERRAELRRVFLDMMKYAAANEAQLVLIPGDLFDSSYVSRDTADVLCRGFETAACPVVICPGNHDRYVPESIYASGRLPGNVFVFRDEKISCFDFPELGVSVWGAAFTRDTYENTPLAHIPPLPDDRVHILCQHGDIRVPNQKCPLRPADIAYRGFTYAALGHIHIAGEPETIGQTTIAYSGCPMGRSFDEPGFGGALDVIIDDKKAVKINKIRFSEKRYMIERLDVTGVADDRALSEKIRALIAAEGYGAETALRIILEGGIPIGFRPSLGALAKICLGGLDALELKDKTIPGVGVDELECDMTLRGALYRTLAPKLSSGDEYERAVAAEALRAGLAAIDGRAIFNDNTPADLGELQTAPDEKTEKEADEI